MSYFSIRIGGFVLLLSWLFIIRHLGTPAAS